MSTGLKQIKIVTFLVYDDGIIAQFDTNAVKDIRHGEFFDDKQAMCVLTEVANQMSEIIEEKTLNGLHGGVINDMYDNRDVRKPKYGDDFSLN